MHGRDTKGSLLSTIGLRYPHPSGGFTLAIYAILQLEQLSFQLAPVDICPSHRSLYTRFRLIHCYFPLYHLSNSGFVSISYPLRVGVGF